MFLTIKKDWYGYSVTVMSKKMTHDNSHWWWVVLSRQCRIITSYPLVYIDLPCKQKHHWILSHSGKQATCATQIRCYKKYFEINTSVPMTSVSIQLHFVALEFSLRIFKEATLWKWGFTFLISQGNAMKGVSTSMACLIKANH